MYFHTFRRQPSSAIHLAQLGIYDKLGEFRTGGAIRNWRKIEREVILFPRGFARTIETGWAAGTKFNKDNPEIYGLTVKNDRATLYETYFFSWSHELTKNMQRALAVASIANTAADVALAAYKAGIFDASDCASTWFSDTLTHLADEHGGDALGGAGTGPDAEPLGELSGSSITDVASSTETFLGLKDDLTSVVAPDDSTTISSVFARRAQLREDLQLLQGKLMCLAVQQITLLARFRDKQGQFAAPTSIIKIGQTNLTHIALATGIEGLDARDNPDPRGMAIKATRDPWMHTDHGPHEPRKPTGTASLQYLRRHAHLPIVARPDLKSLVDPYDVGFLPRDTWVHHFAEHEGAKSWNYPWTT